MEERETFDHEHHQATKAQLVLLMQTGYPWHKAAATAGRAHQSINSVSPVTKSHVHREKPHCRMEDMGIQPALREAVLQWLQAFCRTAPQTPSREVQAALQEQFGIQVSIGGCVARN